VDCDGYSVPRALRFVLLVGVTTKPSSRLLARALTHSEEFELPRRVEKARQLLLHQPQAIDVDRQLMPHLFALGVDQLVVHLRDVTRDVVTEATRISE
jgi:hypothetical protein